MHAAGLLLLAVAPFVAADIVGDGTRQYASQGACMDPTTQITVCFRPGATSSNPSLTQTECEAASNVWYAKGAVGSDGCCLCDSNCDHSLETAAAGTCNYADTNAGSCKIAASGQVICDVVASQCASPNVWSAAGGLDSDGCCFCDETCDHSAETGTDCHSKGYADESQSDGACYDFTTHTIDCDIGHAACDAMGAYWYSPGYISGSSGCCWCDASCDHSLETGTDCSSGYFGADGSPGSGGGHGAEYTFAPTPWPTGNGSCYDYVTFTWTCNVMESTCTTQSGGGYWYAPGYIGWNGCCWCDDASCDHSLETGTDCSSKYSKTNYWEAGSGWCSSDLDQYVGDTSTASACWTECEGRYGSDLVAIDWTPDGECYCQDDCQCMEDTEDSDIQMLTRSDVASLPDVCISACPAEEAAFEDCLSQQNSLDDDFFSGDDDDDGDDDDFSPQSCDDVQQHLSNGECEGPAVCQTEYQAYVECTYEDVAQSSLGLTCDFTCAPPTPPFEVDGNTTSTCIAPPDGAGDAEDADGTGSCAGAWLYERDREPWVPGATGCLGRSNFGCQKCDGSDHPWCEAVDEEGEHTGWCYCSDEDTDEESKGTTYFLEIDTTPTDEACTIVHDHGDAYGPITGDYKCATSWKYTEATHNSWCDDDDDSLFCQTWQTWYGCGPRTLDGSVWDGYFWCEAVDASGEYVGWCDCEQAPSSAPTKTSAPTPAPAAGALGSDGARKTTIHYYLSAATLLFFAF